MGLPLFIPPVESDVSTKPSTKTRADPSHARSSIRRDRRRQLNETREQNRIRLITAIQGADSNDGHHPALQPSSSARSTSHHPDTPQTSARVPELPQNFMSFEDPRENARISAQPEINEILTRIARSNIPRGSAIDDLDDAWTQLGFAGSLELPSIRSSSAPRSTALPSSSRHGPSYTTRRVGLRRMIDRDNEEGRSRRGRYAERDMDRSLYRDAGRLSRHATFMAHRHAQWVRYVDGLGDRDRSLSPEGDAAWDTLQNTLTPDPQPPSAGSSFASANSLHGSESNATTSVNTSMTTPNEETEPPCDPVVDNPGSDGEDDAEERPSQQSWRSYADVVADAQSGQSFESADTNDTDREWLSGMHRIVRGLATRVDIPDEWWAQAGLSRSISWEDSL
ncbi:hypothetical protein F5Y08DRAFT_308512 [Xylaria arbuscula]|nr:hypothetical protein F5Y08DRAFT_308512 [Xylaria arbuscula]